jgi:arylsulfatase A-like enzyme
MTDSKTRAVESGPSAVWGTGGLLLFGLGVGVATGFAEAALLLLQKSLTDRILFLSRHLLWMRPLAEGVLFLTLTALLIGLGRRVPRARSFRTVAFLCTFLAAATALFLIPRFHPVARLILAAGIAVPVSAFVDRLLARRGNVVRVVASGLIAVALLIGVWQTAFRASRETRAVAALPEASPGAPNVLLLILDTVRAKSLGLYGYSKPTTPMLEAFARDGVRFDRAIAPAPWTLPSHATIFTGRQPHELTADWRRPLDGSFPTLAEFLGSRGYATAGFVANMGYCGWESGLDRGFQHYEDQPASVRQFILESSLARWVIDLPLVRRLAGSDENFVRKTAADVNQSFLSWLDARADSSRPFFAFLNYYDAHAPYMPPEPYRSAFATGSPRGGVSPLHRWNSDPFGPVPPPDVIRMEREAYEGAIAYLDAEIGRLVDRLAGDGMLENTLVIITSDHGEEFGEHAVFDHGNSLYMEGLHVPLAMRFADLPPGAVVERPVSLRDLPATVVDLLGLADDSPFPGQTLVAEWDARRPEVSRTVLSEVTLAPRLPDWFPVSQGDMQSLVSGRWHFISGGTGEELYDIASDLAEMDDLTGRAGFDQVQRALRDSLGALAGEVR